MEFIDDILPLVLVARVGGNVNYDNFENDVSAIPDTNFVSPNRTLNNRTSFYIGPRRFFFVNT